MPTGLFLPLFFLTTCCSFLALFSQGNHHLGWGTHLCLVIGQWNLAGIGCVWHGTVLGLSSQRPHSSLVARTWAWIQNSLLHIVSIGTREGSHTPRHSCLAISVWDVLILFKENSMTIDSIINNMESCYFPNSSLFPDGAQPGSQWGVRV